MDLGRNIFIAAASFANLILSGVIAVSAIRVASSAPSTESIREASSKKKFKLIGKGTFGEVWLMQNEDGSFYAAKHIKASETRKKAAAERELEILKGLNHPNVVRTLGSENTEGNFIILMEYIDGTTLDKKERLPMEKIRLYTKQMCEALEYLHGQQVLHCDLKGNNIMVTKDDKVKLIDFGLARYANSPSRTTGEPVYYAENPTAYLPFMAPELCDEMARFSPSSDIWALGMTLYQMVTGNYPYSGYSPERIKQLIKAGPPSLPANCPDNVKSFFAACTSSDPSQRWSAKKLLGHPLLASK